MNDILDGPQKPKPPVLNKYIMMVMFGMFCVGLLFKFLHLPGSALLLIIGSSSLASYVVVRVLSRLSFSSINIQAGVVSLLILILSMRLMGNTMQVILLSSGIFGVVGVVTLISSRKG